MTFEAKFFGPGNRLRWAAIEAGTVPAEILQRLAPFLEDFGHDREVVMLPRVREDGGEVLWYVLCSSPRTTRIARDQVQAFVGPTYSNFAGRITQMDPRDPVEAAVLAKYKSNAFRIEVSNRDIFEAARERLGLLLRLEKERPSHHGMRKRPSGRILRDFEYALLTNQQAAAAACIDELRSAGHVSAANLLFLEVRKLAAAQQWDALLALPALQELLNVARPRRVTEALIRAVYSKHLKDFEQSGHAGSALEVFRSEIWPRFRNLYQTRANLFGFEVDASFIMATACDSARPAIGHSIVESYDPGSPSRAYLVRLLDLIPQTAPWPRTISGIDAAREAFSIGDVDRAYQLASQLPHSFDRSALLLRCAREMGTLTTTQFALESLLSLSESDRTRIDHHLILSRIRNELAAVTSEPTTPLVAEDIPSSWPAWLRRLMAPDPWKAAVFVAETGAREWSHHAFVHDAEGVEETANLLLSDRPPWGQESLRDALPYFLEFCRANEPDPRLKRVYESLFLTVAVDLEFSIPQTAALIRIAQARLQLGVSRTEYIEIVRQVRSTLEAIDSPTVAELALDALEMLVNAACPDTQERQEFAVHVVTFIQRWYKRIDRAQFGLLKTLTTELGMPDTVGKLVKESPDDPGISEWAQLNGKRIALYSLQESALRRAALVIKQLSAGIRVDTFSDHVGGSPALRKAATAADIFILAIGAAKHAATTFVEARRPSNSITLYARGQGSASLLRAVTDHLRATTV